MKIENKILNSTLSFNGVAFQNFLKDGFKLIMFGKEKDRSKKSLLSPFFKADNHRDSLEALKAKSPIFY